MNTTAISPLSVRSQDFTALQSTLQAGNITGAQSAFAALLQDVQKTQSANGASSLFAPGTPAARDLAALGGALKSADLTGARKAFATLEQDIQTSAQSGAGSVAVGNHHHPTTPAQAASNGSASALNPAQAAVASISPQAIGNLLNLKA